MSTESLRSRPSGLLGRLGERVREERSARGLSRAKLASRSGVSLRFLAQVESGQSNISLQRLDEIATALQVPLVRLLDGHDGDVDNGNHHAADDPTTSARLQSLLSMRTPEELHETLEWMTERFLQEKRRRVALLGLRGAGKTSVGRSLARALRVPFFELDALIEKTAGLSLQEIFDLQGQEAFRHIEHRTLARFLAENDEAVLATGGGIVTSQETWPLLQRSCNTVWLKARPEDHWNRVVQQGDQRPMRGHPAAMQELRSLLAKRESAYARADLSIDTSDRSVQDVVTRIVYQLRQAQPDAWADA